MPTWLQVAVGVVALLSFGLSLFLAWLRLQEWRAKPDLRLDMDWIIGGGESTTLRIVAENRGRARGGVRNIVLSLGEHHDPKTSFAWLSHQEELPVMLDPGDFKRVEIRVDPKQKDNYTFTGRLVSGGFTHAILIDQDGKPRAFPIPAQPEDTENRVSLVGRVVRK